MVLRFGGKKTVDVAWNVLGFRIRGVWSFAFGEHGAEFFLVLVVLMKIVFILMDVVAIVIIAPHSQGTADRNKGFNVRGLN